MSNPCSEAYHAVVQLIDKAYSGTENKRAIEKLSKLHRIACADARREAFEEAAQAAESAGCGCARDWEQCDHDDAARRIAADIRDLATKVKP